MIYCPNCGTANRDGSKFCNECGARLAAPGTGTACPECGTFNPVTRLFCQKCGARLVTVAPEPEPEEPEGMPVTGFSLPSRLLEQPPEGGVEKPSAGEEEALIPGWLADLEPEVAEGGLPPEAPAAPAEEVEAPDWLRQLRSGLPSEPEAEAAPEAPVPEAEAAPAEEVEAPDWLRQLRASLPPLEEEAEARPPAWLTEEGEPYPRVPVFAEPVAGVEKPLLPEETPPLPEEVAPGSLPLEIPPWLEGLEEEVGVEAPPPPPVGEHLPPPWLAEPAPEERAAEAAPPPVEAVEVPPEPPRVEAEEEEMLPE
ncbi:MAG: zinc ribbon domain-containing protein [Anaerolineae bacterium]